jgi:hypothetical protein
MEVAVVGALAGFAAVPVELIGALREIFLAAPSALPDPLDDAQL